MNPQFREKALKANRLAWKNITGHELAKRMKLKDAAEANHLVAIGERIMRAEEAQLSDAEFLVMKTLVRLEARRIDRGEISSAKSKAVDHAAGKPVGWCARIVTKRLREVLGYVYHSVNGYIWLTQAGWAFCWAAKLIKPNWRVPL